MVLSMQGNCSKCSGRPGFSRQTTVSGEAVKDSHRPETSFITSVASLDYMMADIVTSGVFKIYQNPPSSTFSYILMLSFESKSLCLHAILQLQTRTWDAKHVRAFCLMKGTSFLDVKTDIKLEWQETIHGVPGTGFLHVTPEIGSPPDHWWPAPQHCWSQTCAFSETTWSKSTLQNSQNMMALFFMDDYLLFTT